MVFLAYSFNSFGIELLRLRRSICRRWIEDQQSHEEDLQLEEKLSPVLEAYEEE